MFRSSPLALLTLLAGCATSPVAVVDAPPPPPAPVAAPVMPAGGVPGMVLPVRLADGSWPTPGRSLSADGAVWHLRAALNVAALSCRHDAATIVPAYNALLSSRRTALAATQARYAAEWKAGGGDWQDRYDDAMTRAYNFYGQSFARPAFCAAAASALAELAATSDSRFADVAGERLRLVEAPFADFFTAYAAWRDVAAPMVAATTPATITAPTVLSSVDTMPAAPAALMPVAATQVAATQVAVAVPAAKPWLRVDPAVYAMP